jgi:sulfur carrier protein ThiS
VPEVTVVLHTIYQIQTPDGVVTKRVMPIEPGLNVGKLLQELGVTIYDDSTLLVVNGKIVAEDHLLQDGDEFHLIPAISGGSQPMER